MTIVTTLEAVQYDHAHYVATILTAPSLHSVRAVPCTEPPALAQATAGTWLVRVDVVVEDSCPVKPVVDMEGVKLYGGIRYQRSRGQRTGEGFLRVTFR